MRPTVGLALSGGAIRGAAHIGVLKVFEAHRIPIDFISGTSIGALVGTLYAFGLSAERIQEIAVDLDWLDVSKFIIPKMGLLSNESMGELLEKLLGPAVIEESKIPLAIVAADVNTGEKVVFRSGPVGHAVMASSCIPGIFAPVQDDGRLLVDGLVVENVPISPLLAWNADVIVAVDLSGERKYKNADDIIDVIMNAFEIAVDTHTATLLKHADVVIQPRVARFSRTHSDQVMSLIEEGERAAQAKIFQVQDLLAMHEPHTLRRFGRLLARKLKRKFSKYPALPW